MERYDSQLVHLCQGKCIVLVIRHNLVAVFLVLTLLIVGPAYAGAKSQNVAKKAVDDMSGITGFWYTEQREAGVELYKCGQEICGKFRWLQSDRKGESLKDVNNPDPSNRDRSLCHLQFMGGFRGVSPTNYDGGWIYSPEHGANFDASITVIDTNTIELHGYLVVPAFGDSQTWTRSLSMPDCAKPPKPLSGKQSEKKVKQKKGTHSGGASKQ